MGIAAFLLYMAGIIGAQMALAALGGKLLIAVTWKLWVKSHGR